MVMESALSGVRIIDFSRAVAGPYGTLLLADLGAEVIKIDQVPSEIETKAAALDADWATLFGYPVSEEGRNTPDGKRRWAQGAAHFLYLLTLKLLRVLGAFYLFFKKHPYCCLGSDNPFRS